MSAPLAFFSEPWWGILLFTVVLNLTAVMNLITLKKESSFGRPQITPLISGLVPARNEAHNIKRWIESLLEQLYGNFEVLVLDDESEDGTAKILDRLARDKPRLKIITGETSPKGRAGKQWACQQLSYRRGISWYFFDLGDQIRRRMDRELNEALRLTGKAESWKGCELPKEAG
jgi:cellulose synthase/poly-beta-1,6-N-acetylglucosamine synthase-like glycosyltransferase